MSKSQSQAEILHKIKLAFGIFKLECCKLCGQFQMPVIDVDSDQSPRAGPSSQPSSGPAVVTKTPEINVEDSDEDDYVDASDMMDDLDDDFMGRGGGATSTGTGSRSNVGSRLQSLLPDDYGSDETMAAIKFSEEFTNR